LLGGGKGSGGLDLVNDVRIAAKSQTRLNPDDRVTFQTPGGGGMGKPENRSRDAIKTDIESGLVTEARAKQDYGYST
jgi:N-methylhydantoinase B